MGPDRHRGEGRGGEKAQPGLEIWGKMCMLASRGPSGTRGYAHLGKNSRVRGLVELSPGAQTILDNVRQ